MKSFWTARLLAVALATGCSENRSVEGPSTETSGLAARVVDSLGRAVAGVEVRVLTLGDAWRERLERNQSQVLATGSTDDSGLVRFALPDTKPVALEAAYGTFAGRIEAVPGSDTLRELRTARSLRLGVLVRVPGEVVSNLYLVGTDRRALRLSDSTWQFPSLPSGTYSVVARTDSGYAVLGRVPLSGRDLDTTLSSDVDSVLLEDFAVPSLRHRYGDLLGDGWWYTTTDRIEGGASRVTPSRVPDALVPCTIGQCLAMDFVLDPTRAARWAIVGLDIDGGFASPPERLADLTRVTSVRFEAAGSGGFWLQLGVRTLRGNFSSCRASFSAPATLTTIDIPLDGLACDSTGTDLRTTYSVTWGAQGDGRLELGKVRLIGAGPRAVFPRLSRP